MKTFILFILIVIMTTSCVSFKEHRIPGEKYKTHKLWPKNSPNRHREAYKLKKEKPLKMKHKSQKQLKKEKRHRTAGKLFLDLLIILMNHESYSGT